MDIIIANPPIYEEAKKKFDLDSRDGILFTYGATIYNPSNIHVDEFLLAHEETHMRQHLTYPGGPEAWWKRYLVDDQFRAEQETEAYATQYKTFCAYNADRNYRAVYLHKIAGHLSSGLYAGIMEYSHARSIIKESAEKK